VLLFFEHDPDNEDIGQEQHGSFENWGRPSAPRKRRNPSVGPDCVGAVAVTVRSATWSRNMAAGER